MSTAAPTPAPSFLPAPATTGLRSVRSLLGLSLRRQGSQRAVTGLITLLAAVAVAMFAFPGVTDLIGRHNQAVIAQKFNDPGFKTVYRQGHVAVGDGLTRLVIDNPRVQVNVLVVEGTSVAALRAGAGHYQHTPYPCTGTGNVGIAGHRTTYGRPFNRINDMRPGDTVRLITPVSRCVYQVVPGFDGHANPYVVAPTDVAVVSQAGDLEAGPWLTLTSCNPPGSAAQRIVLRLRMTSCNGSSCQHQGSAT
jgi:sortase A